MFRVQKAVHRISNRYSERTFDCRVDDEIKNRHRTNVSVVVLHVMINTTNLVSDCTLVQREKNKSWFESYEIVHVDKKVRDIITRIHYASARVHRKASLTEHKSKGRIIFYKIDL